jgi:hypothetical protein
MRVWIQNIVYLLVAFGVVLAVNWVAQGEANPPVGIILPAKTTYPPQDPQAVLVHDVRPLGAKNLGLVRVEMHVESFSEAKKAQTIAYAKQLAASVGANGIVLQVFNYDQQSAMIQAMQKYVLRGQAIYFP